MSARTLAPALRTRATALATALALGLTLVPATAALAATPTARSIESACPADRTPKSNYSDVRGTTFEREIDCIAAYGLAVGIASNSSYGPNLTVNRAEMTTYLANVLKAAGRQRPSNLHNAFPDDDGSPHRANIDWLASLGLVKGYSDGNFHPNDAVSRAGMTTFINRVIGALTSRQLTSNTDWFVDDQGSVHESSINGLAGAGLVTGTGPERFSPTGQSTRGHMAGFLSRTLAELVDRGVIEVPFGPKVITVTPSQPTSLVTSDNVQSGTRDRGQRSFTASVPAGISRVTIALFGADQVRRATDGRLLFAGNAVLGRSAGIGIEILDGVRLDQADTQQDVTQLNDIAVGSDGVVNFTIDGANIGAVVPVVWDDTIRPSDNLLDLPAGTSASDMREALESVGAGGATNWGPPEPARNQNLPTGTIRELSLSAGWYAIDTGGSSAADYLVRINSNDNYRYTASAEPVAGSPGPITLLQFSTWLSVGDRVDPSDYSPGNMTHTIVGDIPLAPSNVAASSQANGTVKITFSKPGNPVADDAASSFRLERAPSTGTNAGVFTEIASRSGDKTNEFIDTPTANGTWTYRVLSRSVTGTSPVSNVASVGYQAPAAPYPTSTTSRVAADNGSDGTGSANQLLDRGDRLEFTFDRPVDVAGNWSVTLQDRDGTRSALDNANATPVLSTDGKVLTIHIGSAGPRLVRAGSDSVIDISPAANNANSGFLQVISAQGIAGSGPWNLPGGPGRTVLDGTGAGRRLPDAPSGHITFVGGTNRIELGRDEVQTISATNANTGTWRVRLTGGSDWSTDLSVNASAAEVQSALEALTGIGVGNVRVTGGPIKSAAMEVTFRAARSALDVPTLVIDDANVDQPGSYVAPGVTTTTSGVAVAGVVTGDRVRVADVQGVQLLDVAAGPNGRTTITLASNVASGTKVLVFVEKLDTGRISATTTLTAS